MMWSLLDRHRFTRGGFRVPAPLVGLLAAMRWLLAFARGCLPCSIHFDGTVPRFEIRDERVPQRVSSGDSLPGIAHPHAGHQISEFFVSFHPIPVILSSPPLRPPCVHPQAK